MTERSDAQLLNDLSELITALARLNMIGSKTYYFLEREFGMSEDYVKCIVTQAKRHWSEECRKSVTGS